MHLATGAVLFVMVISAIVWFGAQLAATLFGDGPMDAGLADAGTALFHLKANADNPAAAWPDGSGAGLRAAVRPFRRAPIAAIPVPGESRSEGRADRATIAPPSGPNVRPLRLDGRSEQVPRRRRVVSLFAPRCRFCGDVAEILGARMSRVEKYRRAAGRLEGHAVWWMAARVVQAPTQGAGRCARG